VGQRFLNDGVPAALLKGHFSGMCAGWGDEQDQSKSAETAIKG
jgi:hypothetical protein